MTCVELLLSVAIQVAVGIVGAVIGIGILKLFGEL